MIGTNVSGVDKGTAMSDVARAQEVQPLDWPVATGCILTH